MEKGKTGFRYKPKFGIVVVCQDERDQRRKYARLLKLGWKLRVVVV